MLHIALLMGCAKARLNGQNGSSGSQASATPTPAPAQLRGVYEITEVDEKGIVQMVNRDKQDVTIGFFPDGSYARSTKDKGQLVHSDSGSFVFDGNSQLTLTTTVEDRNIAKSTKEKKYKCQLSPDGSELRLWGSSDNVAVFQRTEQK